MEEWDELGEFDGGEGGLLGGPGKPIMKKITT
jgi:hypothetical protein